MEQEFPLLIYTHQMYDALKTQITNQTTCQTFYQKTFGLRAAQFNLLCMNDTDPKNTFNITKFNLYQNLKESCKAWVNIYLNNNTMNPADYVDLLYLLGNKGSDINAMLFGKTSKIKTFF